MFTTVYGRTFPALVLEFADLGPMTHRDVVKSIGDNQELDTREKKGITFILKQKIPDILFNKTSIRHNDIHLGNILEFSSPSSLKLTDFGEADIGSKPESYSDICKRMKDVNFQSSKSASSQVDKMCIQSQQ